MGFCFMLGVCFFCLVVLCPLLPPVQETEKESRTKTIKRASHHVKLVG